MTKKNKDVINAKKQLARDKKAEKLEAKKQAKLAKVASVAAKKLEKKMRVEAIYNSAEYKIRQIAKEQHYGKSVWFKLDNAGLIYPALARDNNAIFRLTALMKEVVDPVILQKALNIVVPRFPSITSSLKAGFFWWYLDAPTSPLVVEEQTDYSCRPFKLDHRRSMIRVLYTEHEISIEHFHTATDGSGGTAFLNCLIATYLQLKGIAVLDRTNCPNALDKPRIEEVVDSFQSAYNSDKTPKPEHVLAMHMKGKSLPKNIVIHRKAIMESAQLKQAAYKYGATITQYLAAVELLAIRKHAQMTLNKDKKPIRLSVPINLRPIYHSKTLRNFSSYFYCQYVEGTFEQLVEEVKKKFAQGISKDYYQGNINFNLSSQNNIIMRIVPLPLKMIALKIAYKTLGYKQNSGSLSNLGVVKAPAEFAEQVSRYEFSFGASFCEPVGVTVASYNGITTVIFSSVIDDSLFERYFVAKLVEDGITIAVESNNAEDLL